MATRWLCLLFLLLASAAGFGNEVQADNDKEGSGDSPKGVSVSKYCERFAKQYVRRVAMTYQPGSTRIRTQSDGLLFFSNLFQPSDSRFTAAYICHFQAQSARSKPMKMAVSLYLTNTLPFAEHTQWERLQLIPIAYVTDRATGKAGYGVFKYLETP